MNNGAQRSWWSRHWKWVVPLVLLGCPCVCGGGVLGIASVVFGSIKQSDVYVQTVARATHDPRVIAITGEPVETGFMLSGSVNVNGASGEASLAIPVSGPRASGRVYVVAHKRMGQWNYESMQFDPENGTPRIDLMH